MATMIGETGIVHRQGREFGRNVHFPGEIPVAGGGSRFGKRNRCEEWEGFVFIAKGAELLTWLYMPRGSYVAWVICVPKAIMEHLGG
ncbi:hypothetical protein E2542_SST23468 [Spatholobus suberectus]|nr:hypothetical protein E2542_SST23468 [Spatholobus suberectus]